MSNAKRQMKTVILAGFGYLDDLQTGNQKFDLMSLKAFGIVVVTQKLLDSSLLGKVKLAGINIRQD